MKETRRRQLQALLDGPYRGNRATLMADSGLSHGRISQLLSEHEPFGDAAARNLLKKLQPKLGLPDDYFENEGTSTANISAIALGVARRVDSHRDNLEHFRAAYAVVMLELDRLEREWKRQANAPDAAPRHPPAR